VKRQLLLLAFVFGFAGCLDKVIEDTVQVAGEILPPVAETVVVVGDVALTVAQHVIVGAEGTSYYMAAGDAGMALWRQAPGEQAVPLVEDPDLKAFGLANDSLYWLSADRVMTMPAAGGVPQQVQRSK
jgi:hypothetical protein